MIALRALLSCVQTVSNVSSEIIVCSVRHCSVLLGIILIVLIIMFTHNTVIRWCNVSNCNQMKSYSYSPLFLSLSIIIILSKNKFSIILCKNP